MEMNRIKRLAPRFLRKKLRRLLGMLAIPLLLADGSWLYLRPPVENLHGPPLLLVHGWAASSGTWGAGDNLAEDLTNRRYAVWRLDWSESPRLRREACDLGRFLVDAGYSIQDSVGEIAAGIAAVASLSGDRPITVVTHSTGGLLPLALFNDPAFVEEFSEPLGRIRDLPLTFDREMVERVVMLAVPTHGATGAGNRLFFIPACLPGYSDYLVGQLLLHDHGGPDGKPYIDYLRQLPLDSEVDWFTVWSRDDTFIINTEPPLPLSVWQEPEQYRSNQIEITTPDIGHMAVKSDDRAWMDYLPILFPLIDLEELELPAESGGEK